MANPLPAAPLLRDDAPGNLKISADLNQFHAPRQGGAHPGDQFTDAGNKLGRDVHSSPRMVSSTAAPSASSAAISSMISPGLRWTTASPPHRHLWRQRAGPSPGERLHQRTFLERFQPPVLRPGSGPLPAHPRPVSAPPPHAHPGADILSGISRDCRQNLSPLEIHPGPA